MTRTTVFPALAFLAAALVAGRADDPVERLTVGVQPDGRIVVPTNQVLHPAGRQVAFPGRPVDLLVVEDGRTLVVKDMHDLVFVDIAGGAVKQTLGTPVQGKEQPGFSVVGLVARGDRVFVSDAQHHVRVARRGGDGRYAWEGVLALEKPADGPADAAGMAELGPDRLLVATTRTNAVQVLNCATGEVEQAVPVGVAPYGVLPVGPDKAYVSNW